MTTHETHDEVIRIGPIAPVVGGAIYHVTLESGAIVTSPIGFDTPAPSGIRAAIVSADGRFLVPPESPSGLSDDSDEPSEEWTNFERLARPLVQGV